MNHEQVSRGSHWLQDRFVLIVFLAFAGLLFFTNQLRFLPLLLLLACPLMHLFMHRGHGNHNDRPHH